MKTTQPQITKSKFTRFTYREEWGEFSRVSEYSIKDKAVGERPTIHNSSDLEKLIRAEYPPHQITTKEMFFLVIMNQANKVLTVAKISEGSDTGTVADPAEILRRCLLIGGKSFVVAHNHPSGNTNPSPADKAITNRIAEAAKLLDLRLLDHVILSENDYLSMADEGLINN